MLRDNRDRCLCAPRWQEALEANQAPRVVLRATREASLSYCSLTDLKRLAVDLAFWGRADIVFARRRRAQPFVSASRHCAGRFAGGAIMLS
jgi:Uncharacterized protein conserved in bacteria (DUF2237)